MSDKKIVVEIHEDGALHAETFGFYGTECTEELDRLMKDIARLSSRSKKPEYFSEKRSFDITVKNKNA